MTDETAAEPKVETRNRAQVDFQLMPSGKPVRLDIPTDITEPEGFALVEAVIQVIRHAQQSNQPSQIARPRLIIPG